jgi:hypothetical protein
MLRMAAEEDQPDRDGGDWHRPRPLPSEHVLECEQEQREEAIRVHGHVVEPGDERTAQHVGGPASDRGGLRATHGAEERVGEEARREKSQEQEDVPGVTLREEVEREVGQEEQSPLGVGCERETGGLMRIPERKAAFRENPAFEGEVRLLEHARRVVGDGDRQRRRSGRIGGSRRVDGRDRARDLEGLSEKEGVEEEEAEQSRENERRGKRGAVAHALSLGRRRLG